MHACMHSRLQGLDEREASADKSNTELRIDDDKAFVFQQKLPTQKQASFNLECHLPIHLTSLLPSML